MAHSLSDEHVFLEDSNLAAGLTSTPTTPGHVLVKLNDQLFVNPTETKRILGVVRQIALNLCELTSVKRCGMAYDGDKMIHVIPLHQLGEEWAPVLDDEMEFHEEFPGYLTTKSSPEHAKEKLDDMQRRITANSKSPQDCDTTFDGDETDTNLFARIVRGELPQWRVWESSSHIAFLTPFANTPGFTVLIPRKHTSSDIFSLEVGDYNVLVEASCSVAMLLKQSLGLQMCGMFFEGLEIDYTHAKLVPVHIGGADLLGLGAHPVEEYHESYRGSISTRLGSTAYPAKELLRMASELRSTFSA